MAGVVRTVLGPIEPAGLGVTSMHEHLWMDSTPLLAVHGYDSAAEPGPWTAAIAAEARWNPGIHPDNYRLTDEDAAVEELAAFAALGGRTVVDLTPAALGGDPARLAAISARSGLHVVAGAGQYLGAMHESWVARAEDRALVGRLVSDARDGLEPSGIRPGIFGEVGTSDPVEPSERRMLRAVAAAAHETGLATSIHLHPWGHEGPLVLELLEAAGADPERVILGHVSTAIDRPDDLRGMLDRGAVLGFDLFGFDHSLLGLGRWPPSDLDVGAVVARLVAEGYGAQLVLGQDVGVRTRLKRWGGWGYDHLLRHVAPLLGELGVGPRDLDTMLVATPRRLLEVPA
jgi:phosphotriesterase-related protein